MIGFGLAVLTAAALAAPGPGSAALSRPSSTAAAKPAAVTVFPCAADIAPHRLCPAATGAAGINGRPRAAISFAPYLGRRGRFIRLFDASFNDRWERSEYCLKQEPSRPPRRYLRAAVTQWWHVQSNLPGSDGLASEPGLATPAPGPLASYAYCLQNRSF